MKIKVLLIALLVFLFSCSREEQNSMDLLTKGTWVYKKSDTVSECLNFNNNMTYVISTNIENIISSSSLVYEMGSIKGNWILENNQITFLTANLELNSNNTEELNFSVLEGESLVSFYGFQLDSLTETRPELDSSYMQITWNIIELSKSTLIVDNGSLRIKYHKE